MTPVSNPNLVGVPQEGDGAPQAGSGGGNPNAGNPNAGNPNANNPNGVPQGSESNPNPDGGVIVNPNAIDGGVPQGLDGGIPLGSDGDILRGSDGGILLAPNAGVPQGSGEGTGRIGGNGNPIKPGEKVYNVTIADKITTKSYDADATQEEIVFNADSTGGSNGGGGSGGSSSSDSSTQSGSGGSSSSSSSDSSTKSSKHSDDLTITTHFKSVLLGKQFLVQLGKFKKDSPLSWFPKRFNKIYKFFLDENQIDTLLTGDSKIMYKNSTANLVSYLQAHMASVMLQQVPSTNAQKLTPLLQNVTFSYRTRKNEWKHLARSQKGWTALGKHAYKLMEPVVLCIDPGSIYPTHNEPDLNLHLVDNLSPDLPTSRRIKKKKKKPLVTNNSPIPIQEVNVPQDLQSISPFSKLVPKAMMPEQSSNSINGGSLGQSNNLNNTTRIVPSKKASLDTGPAMSVKKANASSESIAGLGLGNPKQSSNSVDGQPPKHIDSSKSIESNDSFKNEMAGRIAGIYDLIDGIQAQVYSKKSYRKPPPSPAGQCNINFGIQDSSPALRAAIASASPEDTFNLNLLPKDVADRVNARENDNIHLSKISLTRFNNQLTVQYEKDMPPRPREYNFVLFPPGRNKFFISRSGFYYNIDTVSSSDLKRFHSNFPICHGSHASDFWNFYTRLEIHCSQYNHYVHPIDEVRMCDDLRGFAVGCHLDGRDVDFPALLQPNLNRYSNEILPQLQSKTVLPPDLLVHVKYESRCCHKALKRLLDIYHPDLQRVTPAFTHRPTQSPHQDIEDHKFRCEFHIRMKAHLEDQHIDFSAIKQQDEFLHSLDAVSYTHLTLPTKA